MCQRYHRYDHKYTALTHVRARETWRRFSQGSGYPSGLRGTARPLPCKNIIPLPYQDSLPQKELLTVVKPAHIIIAPQRRLTM